jgi:uncharacterized YccA/Bax inhibitor family protein
MANPLLKDSVFQNSSQGSDGRTTVFSRNEAMTISGTITKSIFLLFLLGISAVFTWTHPSIGQTLVFPALIAALILSMVCIFKKHLSGIFAPLYAICEGVVLGFISFYYNSAYNGIVFDAVFLTMAVLFCMLAAYKTGLLRATPRFKKVLVLAMAGIFIFYIGSMVMSLFGTNLAYFNNSTSSGAILINLIIVAIAALNFIIDFDMIEQGVRYGAPKFMEWYCSFALMITLVWLYLEILRLLARRR